MRSPWEGLRSWALGLSTGATWGVWAVVALVAAVLMTALPSPWDWAAVAPLVGFGFVLFDAQSRRDEDHDRRG